MAIELFNHESCVASSKIKSAYCTEMSTALDVNFKQYAIPSSVLLTSDVLNIYLAVQTVDGFTHIKVNPADWTIQSGNKITINNQLPANMSIHNRVLFIPKNSLNLCFTGVVGSNISNKRPIWIKRSDTTKMYDYLAITSINYFADFYSILEYPNVTFINGVGSGFTNLTSKHNGMKVDFDGQYAGGINAINGVSSLTLDNTSFSSLGASRAFLYSQGTLEFSTDANGAPSNNWSRHLAIPPIDHDIPYKVWIRDFNIVTNELSVYANNAIRILGTEFIL